MAEVQHKNDVKNIKTYIIYVISIAGGGKIWYNIPKRQCQTELKEVAGYKIVYFG